MNEKLNEFIDRKWKNYSWGLAIGVSLREDKQYRHQDIEDAFSADIYKFLQVIYHNNIDVNNIDFYIEES